MARLAPLYEVCALCEMVKASAEMTTVQFIDTNRHPKNLRICGQCLNPQTVYIQGLPRLRQLDIRELLHLSITISLAVIAVMIGAVIGSGVGLFLVLAGILSGAGSLAVLAVKGATT